MQHAGLDQLAAALQRVRPGAGEHRGVAGGARGVGGGAGELLRYYRATREILRERGADGDRLDRACHRLWVAARDSAIDGDPYRWPDDRDSLRDCAEFLPLAGHAVGD